MIFKKLPPNAPEHVFKTRIAKVTVWEYLDLGLKSQPKILAMQAFSSLPRFGGK